MLLNMEKISKKFLGVVVFISGLLHLSSCVEQTSSRSAKLASDVEFAKQEENILIHGSVIESSEAIPSVDSVAISSFSPATQYEVIASTRLKNGEFQFQVPKSMSGTAMFIFVSKDKSDSGGHFGKSNSAFFMIEDSVNILVDKKSEEIHINITGGRQNQAKDLYDQERNELLKRKNVLRNKKENGVIAPEKYRKEKELLSADFKKQKIQFVTNHPYSFYALDVLHGLVESYLNIPWKDHPGSVELKKHKKLFFSLEKPIQEKGHYLLELLQNVEARKVSSFTGEMPDGKTFDLTSLKGKVILIDFWGSWCGWCRKGHPHLKELYAKYKDKGFEIVGVGMEYGNREEQWTKFRKAIAEDGISWTQILMDRQKQDLAKEYGVSSYPSKFLVDRDGLLVLRVGSDLEGLLDAKLAELFNGDNKPSFISN